MEICQFLHPERLTTLCEESLPKVYPEQSWHHLTLINNHSFQIITSFKLMCNKYHSKVIKIYLKSFNTGSIVRLSPELIFLYRITTLIMCFQRITPVRQLAAFSRAIGLGTWFLQLGLPWGAIALHTSRISSTTITSSSDMARLCYVSPAAATACSTRLRRSKPSKSTGSCKMRSWHVMRHCNICIIKQVAPCPFLAGAVSVNKKDQAPMLSN